MSRTLSWFSCGAASSVASMLALEMYENVEVLYCDTFAYEHPDNYRYFHDVEKWLGISIKVLKSKEYEDIYDVFDRTRFLSGPNGARCTVELKKRCRFDYQQPDDVHIFGLTYDSNDIKRAERMLATNPDMRIRFPLIESQLSKLDCLELLRNVGIETPIMYRLGYNNNNCIGCVKGGAGYWNKIRKDFPDIFNKMADLELRLGAKLTKYKGNRVYLYDLPPDYLVADDSETWECGVVCGS